MIESQVYCFFRHSVVLNNVHNCVLPIQFSSAQFRSGDVNSDDNQRAASNQT